MSLAADVLAEAREGLPAGAVGLAGRRRGHGGLLLAGELTCQLGGASPRTIVAEAERVGGLEAGALTRSRRAIGTNPDRRPGQRLHTPAGNSLT